MSIKLLDYNPHGTFDGDTFLLEIDGREVTIERWSTDSSTGMEFHSKGKPVFDLDTTFGEGAHELSMLLIERVDAAWSKAFTEHLAPIYERERARLVEVVNE